MAFLYLLLMIAGALGSAWVLVALFHKNRKVNVAPVNTVKPRAKRTGVKKPPVKKAEKKTPKHK